MGMHLVVSFDWPETEEINTVNMDRPHLVILGAGASRATFPMGDGNGKELPLMQDFVEVLGLKHLLEENGVDKPYDDFEAMFSIISENKAHGSLRTELEKRISYYFEELRIPSHPTIYDHLILCLRP